MIITAEHKKSTHPLTYTDTDIRHKYNIIFYGNFKIGLLFDIRKSSILSGSRVALKAQQVVSSTNQPVADTHTHMYSTHKHSRKTKGTHKKINRT